MIIECPYCEAKVDGEVKGEHEYCHPEEGPPFKAVLLKCPVCSNALLGGSDWEQTGPDIAEWSELTRLWPQQESHIAWEIPAIARNSLIEARMCYKAKVYNSCVVMAGRTLEGVCQHHSTKDWRLAGGLKELKEGGIIDDRLYEWGEELRKHRNIGAHASEDVITKEDAKDLLDFAQAICDYVFVLNAKFNRFMERKDTD
ncbi:MAG: DUF4145 domain-containing protein [Phycisphaerae bacterium]|nr:DUF4145 domain-containing protein [Phycisphaerae bacterium]